MVLQKRVSELPAVANVAATDQLIVSSSNATKRCTVQQIGAYFQANGVAGPVGPQGPSGASNWSEIVGKPTTFPPSPHTHDDRYYTESEVDSFLAGKQSAGTYATLVGGVVPSEQLPVIASSWSDLSGKPSTVAGFGISDAVVTTDARLSDARQPLSHTHTASQITDFTSAVIAAAPPTTDASLLTQGTLSASRLPASGVSAGTYSQVTVDTTGRVTSGGTHSVGVADVSGLQTALDGKQAAGSYATLVDGLIPASILPSYVDDVLEYVTQSGFPASGETGKIYVARDTNKIYRWSGSTYIEISPSPGSTDSVAEGATNLYFTNARALAATQSALDAKAPIANPTFTGTVSGVTAAMVGLGNVSNVDATARANHTGTQAWSTIVSTPASLSGYGITDGVTTSDSRLTNPREWSASTVTQADAEAGTATTRVAWTVQRVWQAIAAWWETVQGTKANTNHSHGKITADGRLGDAGGAAGLYLQTTTNGVISGTYGLSASQIYLDVGTVMFSTFAWNDGDNIFDFLSAVDNAIAARATASHAHGSITSDGKLGRTANLLVGTGTGGLIGAVALGTGLTLSGGVLSGTATYTLPNATTSTLGGVIVGTGLSVASGTISVVTYSVRSDTVANISYIGRATSGTATSSATWTIRRTTVAADGTVTTATATNVAWDNRLTASYS